MNASSGLKRLERDLPVPLILVLAAVAVALFTLLFSFWTASSPLALPQFVLCVAVLIYLPGKLLLDLGRVRIRPLDDLALSLVLGMTASSLVYWIAAFLGLQPLFLLWPATALAVAVYRRRRSWRSMWQSSVRLDATHVLLCLVIAVQLVPLALLPMYYHNVAPLPQGGMTFLSKPRDAIFHLSIVNELKHSIPPEVPYLAGLPLGYHYGMDLLNAMLSNVGYLSVLDLTARFTPTLLLTMTTLSVFCFSRMWLRSGYGAVLSAFLVVLGEDLSFVPGLLSGSNEVWSVQYFNAPTTFSLYYMNPMLPALGILFGGLLCLDKFLRERSVPWLLFTGFLFAITMEYKIFVAAHVLLVLGIGAVVYVLLFRDVRLVAVLMVTGLLVAPLVLFAVLGTEAESHVWVWLDSWPYIPQALEQLGLQDTWLAREVSSLYNGTGLTLAGILALCLVGLPTYLVGSLGFRVLALPGTLKRVIRPSPSTALGFCLALTVLAGPVIALVFTATPSSYQVGTEYNEAIWFYVLSKYVACILAVELVLAVGRRWDHRWRVLLACAVVVVSVPSALQYFQSQTSYQLDQLSQSELELTGFLEGGCVDGGVVLSRQGTSSLVAALTQCRVPVLNIGAYSHSFVSLSGLSERKEDRARFWSDWNGGELRGDILERYRVDYVVVDRRTGDVVPQEGATLGTGLAETSQSVSLGRVMDNADFAVYEVRWDDE
jgi:hypothetical protein